MQSPRSVHMPSRIKRLRLRRSRLVELMLRAPTPWGLGFCRVHAPGRPASQAAPFA